MLGLGLELTVVTLQRSLQVVTHEQGGGMPENALFRSGPSYILGGITLWMTALMVSLKINKCCSFIAPVCLKDEYYC